MPTRVGSLLTVLPLALSACGWLGSDPDGSIVADSVVVLDTVPVAATEDSAAAVGAPTDQTQPATTEPVAQEGPSLPAGAGGQAAPSLEVRLDQILAGQQALTRRVDSLAVTTRAAAARADTARTLAESGEVLGEASRQVQNFGVGVFWSLIVLVIFNFSIRGLVWLFDTLAERNASRRLFYKRLVPVVRIVLWIFAAYLIIRVIFRVDAQGIFAAAAAVGVAVGFAAQDLLKNLFGGLILVFDQPFQVGDKISVGGTYGEVVSIGLRSTRIVTPDDNLVSVPNAQVVDQQVANANAGELNCQVVTDLYLPGWADEVTAKRIAFEAAASSKYVYFNKPIVVLVSDQFKETFLTRVRVKAYVMDPRLEFLFQSDVTERAREGFRKAGLLKPEHIGLALLRRSALADPFDPTLPVGPEQDGSK